MRSIFNEAEYTGIRKRLENLTARSSRCWGKMDVAQMLAHCNIGFAQALGKVPFQDKSNFIMRTLVKRIVVNAMKKGDLGKNQKTFPEFLVTDKRDFSTEKERLLANLDEFFQKGNTMSLGRHPYFGKFSKDEWGCLQLTHLDHHLRQFSA